MKKILLAGIALAVLLISLTVAYLPYPVRAESAESIGFDSGATLFSPVNTTYSSRFLTLNLTLGAGLGVRYSLNYSLDGKYGGPIPLVAKTPAEMHVINTMIGSVDLPELSEGSHRLTVNELSGIYDYHGANAPGAPFKPAFPCSSDYIASWTHTVYFTINSPSTPSRNPTSTLAHSPSPSSLSGTDPAWVSKATMQEPRSGLGVAVVNGKIYAIGGAGATGFSSTNEEYDPATNTWTFKTPMPTPRSAFGIAVYENRIYCIGGYIKGNPPTGVNAAAVNEVYDPATDTWTSKTPMPTARLNLRANVVNGKIYLIGGIPIPDIGRTLNEVYDPASDTWNTKAPIPTGVDLYASAVVGNKIFVMKSGLTQIYDADSDSWSTGVAPPLNSLIPSAATVTVSDSSVHIYLLGANAEGSYWMLNYQGFTTQSYDPTTGNWTVGTSMPTGRIDAGLAAVNDKLYVIGGYTYGTPSGSSFTLNRPIIYSVATEQYTPALDVTVSFEKTQATTTPTASSPTPFPSPSTTPPPSHSPSPSLSPTPSLTPSSSPSQQPGLDHSPTSENIQAENFTPSIIIFGLVMVSVLMGVLIYLKKIKK